MSQFIDLYGGTVFVVLIVALLVFLAVRRLVLDKKEGIGPCGQKCSHCANAGHCELENEQKQENVQDGCNGVCSGCPYSASCNKNAN